MKWIGELYDKHRDRDIYVVGTGSSLRVFPLDFFDDKITIGLNQAWKFLPLTYCITSVPKFNIPELISDEPERPDITWITKWSKLTEVCDPSTLGETLERFYFFETNIERHLTVGSLDHIDYVGRNLDWVLKADGRKLYLWTSISQAGVNLAANMGARNVILVGCDNASLAGNHHAHDQHTMWRGESPDASYLRYYEGLAEVRTALRGRGVNVISASPFLKLDEPALDFQHLCEELRAPAHIANADVPRGYTLSDDNRRYLRLTKYIFRKNVRHLLGRAPR
jgi:hypothetical protein